MKTRYFMLAALASALVGCTNMPDTPPMGNSAANSSPSSGGSTSTSGRSPTTTAGTGTGVKSGARDWSADNPKRLYQLKTLQTAKLKANGHTIDVWVMDTVGKREEGMMWLSEADVKPNEGMIFVFAKPESQSFWMENTLIPLDIDYISAGKKVVSIANGKALDKTSLPSDAPAQYVLEMKAGAASRLGIKPGTAVTIPNELKSKD